MKNISTVGNLLSDYKPLLSRPVREWGIFLCPLCIQKRGSRGSPDNFFSFFFRIAHFLAPSGAKNFGKIHPAVLAILPQQEQQLSANYDSSRINWSNGEAIICSRKWGLSEEEEVQLALLFSFSSSTTLRRVKFLTRREATRRSFNAKRRDGLDAKTHATATRRNLYLKFIKFSKNLTRPRRPKPTRPRCRVLFSRGQEQGPGRP